jgi:mono/diheme cytochrome c family protein
MKKVFSRFLGVLFIIMVVVLAQWAMGDESEMGKNLYNNKCQMCHGADGKGTGPAASSFSPKPNDFTDPAFWNNNPEKKITDAVENGYKLMPQISLSSDQIKAVIAYISKTFKQ